MICANPAIRGGAPPLPGLTLTAIATDSLIINESYKYIAATALDRTKDIVRAVLQHGGDSNRCVADGPPAASRTQDALSRGGS
jgi:hypothetical protein